MVECSFNWKIRIFQHQLDITITAMHLSNLHSGIIDGRHQSSMSGNQDPSDVAERHSNVLRCVLTAMLDGKPAVVVLHYVICRIRAKKRQGRTKQTSLMIYSVGFGVSF